jgi:hypothetical protein
MDVDKYLESYQTASTEYKTLEEEIIAYKAKINNTAKRKERYLLMADKRKLEVKLQEVKKNHKKILFDYISELIITPGDKESFEEMAGYEVRIVDLKLLNKGVIISQKQGRRNSNTLFGKKDHQTEPILLLENKIVGMIHTQITQSTWMGKYYDGAERLYYGLPVKKIN